MANLLCRPFLQREGAREVARMVMAGSLPVAHSPLTSIMLGKT
jgi:hypothetical protein